MTTDGLTGRGQTRGCKPHQGTQPFWVLWDMYSRRTMDEQEAIRRLKAGDVGALEYLVSRFQVKAIRIAFLITGDPGWAEDVVQESFLRAHRSIRGFDATRPFEPWFLRSVVNRSLKLIHTSAREIPLGDAADVEAFEHLAAQVESVESQVEAAETERQIELALRKLSPRQRAVVVQRYFLDMNE